VRASKRQHPFHVAEAGRAWDRAVARSAACLGELVGRRSTPTAPRAAFSVPFDESPLDLVLQSQTSMSSHWSTLLRLIDGVQRTPRTSRRAVAPPLSWPVSVPVDCPMACRSAAGPATPSMSVTTADGGGRRRGRGDARPGGGGARPPSLNRRGRGGPRARLPRGCRATSAPRRAVAPRTAGGAPRGRRAPTRARRWAATPVAPPCADAPGPSDAR